MIKKLKELFYKYKEIITYLFFGGLTTVISYIVFLFFTKAVPLGTDTLWANVISNAAGITFAYCTNRKWVFESKVTGFTPVIKELGKFVGGRLFTVALDLVFVYLTVDVWGGEGAIWKLVSTVIVVVLNYLISKFIVFTKNKLGKKAESADNTDKADEAK